MKVVVGLADSGIAPELQHRLLAAERFDNNGSISRAPIEPDTLGHGTALSRIINQYCPDAYFVLAQIINPQGISSLPQLNASIPWLSEQAQVINFSLGLSKRDLQLEYLCQQARESGRILIASSPAIGAAVYPANFDTVYAVTGNINCPPEYFSNSRTQKHSSAQANLSACCFQSEEDQEKGIGGSSYAAAHFSGWIAKALSLGIKENKWRALLPNKNNAQPINLVNALQPLTTKI